MTKTVLGKIDPSSRIKGTVNVSPDMTWLAYVARVGDRQCVVVDGEEGTHYDEIGIGIGHRILMPHGKGVAYAARLGDKWFVVADGKEGNRYDEIDLDIMLFSPDGKRIAYRARIGNEWVVVVDGQEGKRYAGVGSREVSFKRGDMPYGVICGPPLAFSPDGTRLAYLATLGGKWFVVVDGQEGKHYDNIVMPEHVFSPDGKKTAYWAQENDQWFTVVDGEQGRPYDVAGIVCMCDSSGCAVLGAGSLVFSPDGKRLAYVAQQVKEDGDPESHLVVDGQDWSRPDCAVLPGPIFSPDSARVAYLEWSGGQDGFGVAVTVDKERGTRYEHASAPVFSPDSRRMAYAAADGAKWFVVLDGQEGKHYDSIGTSHFNARRLGGLLSFAAGPFVFSPNGDRLAYGAQVGDKWIVVVDGQEGKPYDEIGDFSLAFSPDGQTIAYTARTGDVWFVIVGEREATQYTTMPGRGVFDSSNTLRYIVEDGDTISRVDVKPE
ncbi:MAG: PD40 domain-containing protein [Verrucomicrobia bacterium]|nr:PD40 domain-containing protein [Verrucomicrobiota bacterium]